VVLEKIMLYQTYVDSRKSIVINQLSGRFALSTGSLSQYGFPEIAEMTWYVCLVKRRFG